MTEREKHLLWLLMKFDSMRYLVACTSGREDGYEQSERHIKLVKTYIAFVRVCDIDEVDITSDEFDNVHTETQELTGYLPENGFLLERRPDYDRQTPLFFDRFIELAMKALPCEIKRMAPRLKYNHTDCHICNKSIADNWAIRHLKSGCVLGVTEKDYV